jgi:hypothetical protein
MAAAVLLLNAGVAAADAPMVSCTPLNGTLTVDVTSGATSSVDTVAISASPTGNYVVNLGGTAQNPEAGSPVDCASATLSAEPSVVLQDDGQNQYIVLDNSNGALASTSAHCPVSFRSGLTSPDSTVQLNADTSPTAPADDTVYVDSGQHVGLSEAGCIGPPYDAVLNQGVGALVVVGNPGATAVNTLDLGPVGNCPLSIDAGADTFAGPGNVSGWHDCNGSVGFQTVQFANEETIVGPNAGNSTFAPNLASSPNPAAPITFKGQGNVNALDLTTEPAASLSSLTVAQAGGAACAAAGAGAGEVTSTGPHPITDCFTGVSTIAGATDVPTTWQPASTTAGVTFVGQNPAGSTLDLTGETGFTGIQVAMSGGSAPQCSGMQVGRLSTSGGAINVSDSFCGVVTVIGSTTTPTALQPGDTGALNFVGGSAVSNTLDLSNLNSSTGATAVTVAMSGGTAPGCGGSEIGQLTSTGASPAIDDSFCNVSLVGGAASLPTTFQPDRVSGVAFAGNSGVVNTLDLTGIASGFSALTVAMSGGTVPLGCGTAPVGQVTSTGGSPDLADPFCNVSMIDGSIAVPTVFQPGTSSGVTFNGHDAAPGGAVVDLSGEPSSSFTSLTVAMSDGASPCTGGEGELTSTGTSSIIDCLNGITTIDGASAVSTHFVPDPNLSAAATPPPEFVGNDGEPGGAILDLRNLASPDASGDTISGLTLSLPENTQASPGSVTATVDGTPVTYATFSGITTAIGSSTLTTGLVPGDVDGVALVFIPRAPQTVSFTSTPPSSPGVGGTYTVSATGGASGNPVTFSIDRTSTKGACAIAGATVSFTGGGACVVDADQPGTHEYAPATEAQQTITIPGPPAPPSPPPAISEARVGRFRAGTTGTLHVTLSEPATLTFKVTGVAGHRARRRCQAGVRKHAKRCEIAARGPKLSLSGAQGRNALKLAVSKLAPGTYSATVTAANSAGSSKPVSVSFTVTRVRAPRTPGSHRRHR